MNIIFIIHVVFLLWILVTPFLNDRRQLEFYGMIIPFIFYHWSVNDDTCAMTQLEMMLTKQEKEKTFMHRVVSPIYVMEENDVNKLTKTVFFCLWAFSQYRLGHFDMFTQDLKQLFAMLGTRGKSR
jgi:hypothetical protein